MSGTGPCLRPSASSPRRAPPGRGAASSESAGPAAKIRSPAAPESARCTGSPETEPAAPDVRRAACLQDAGPAWPRSKTRRPRPACRWRPDGRKPIRPRSAQSRQSEAGITGPGPSCPGMTGASTRNARPASRAAISGSNSYGPPPRPWSTQARRTLLLISCFCGLVVHSLRPAFAMPRAERQNPRDRTGLSRPDPPL